MEGETVAIALAGAVVVAFLINKFGSRQPAEYRPPHVATDSDAAEDDPADTPTARRRRAPRLPRQRRGSEDSAAQDRRTARTPVDAELLRTLEELAAHPQNRAAAVNLLRQRTGMSARHARRFINAL